MTETLREAKKLYDLGFAILWLRPKEKRPVESGWTTGPKVMWRDLEKTYRKGMNVGVRLGTPSYIKGASFQTKGYLACIDVDVKDPSCKEKALKKLKEITNGVTCPCVLSGSGNGSLHLYVLTPKPFKQITVVRVKDKYEIVIYSDGRQMVLPPSIHPNGKPYRWSKTIDAVGLPFMDFSGLESEKIEDKEAAQDFEISSVQLGQTTLPEKMKAFITDGEGCEDRSAGLLKASISMVRHGLTDNEILTILTEKDTYLGKAAFDHAKTNSRKRAAQWLLKYTVKKARREYDEARHFEKVVSEEDNEPKLSHAEAVKQREDLTPQNFKTKITRNGDSGRPHYTLKNTVNILCHGLGEDSFKRCLFSGYYLNGKRTPWGSQSDTEINDADIAQLTLWLSEKFSGFEPEERMLDKAIVNIAMKNMFHPVRDYLDSLEWDGTRRLDTWMKRLLSARAPGKYLRAVSRKTLIAMVARVYVPGIKFDYVPIWVGKQGARKSTGVEVLASPKWFTDTTIDVANKDGAINMRAKWVIELGELSSMRQADTEHLKAFLSRRTDRYRVPHGKRSEDFDRQSIFIGTTNKDKFLKDPTGNRRFWPVDVGECDIEGLTSERDQLFAEAKFAFELEEPLYLSKEEEQEAEQAQTSRVLADSWDEKLEAFFSNPSANGEQVNFNWAMFKLNDLFEDFGPLAKVRDDHQTQSRAISCLKRLGYTSKPGRKKGVEGKGNYWAKWDLF